MKPLWLLGAAAALAIAWRWRAGGRIARALLAAAAVVAGLVGAGVIDLPSARQLVTDIGDRLGPWTYLLVGVNAFLETGAFLGFIAPGETLVLFGGVLVGAGTIELIPLILIVWGCAVAGDFTSYVIGRRYGRGVLLRYGARLRIGEPQVQVVERFFERHGELTVLFGRWIGVVRPLVPFLAGSTRLPFWRFAAVDVLAALLWSAALSILGSVFWQNFDQLVSLVSRALFIFATVVIVSGTLATLVGMRRSARRGAAVDARLAGLQHDRPVLSRPVTALWALVGRIEAHVPGHVARRAAEPVDTVEDDARASGASSTADHPADP